MERVADPRVSRMGSRDLTEVRDLISAVTGIEERRVDTRLPLRTGVVRRDGKTVGIVAVDRRFGDLVIRAFHFLPDAPDDLAPEYREKLRAGAAEEARKIRLRLRNDDTWAEDFLAPIVASAREAESGTTRAPHPDLLPRGLPWLLTAFGGACAACIASRSADGFRYALPWVAMVGVDSLWLGLRDALAARHCGEIRIELPARRWRTTATGFVSLAAGATIPLALPWFVGGWWLWIWAIAAGLFLLRIRARRPGARDGGITLPGHLATVPWEDVSGWRRTGDGVLLDFARGRPGRWEGYASLVLPRPTADALEVFLRRVVPEATPPRDPARCPPSPRTS